MNYKGKLYGKINGKHVELHGTAEQFDALRELHQAVVAMRAAQKNHAKHAAPMTIREKRNTQDAVDKMLRNFPVDSKTEQKLF